MKRSTFVAVTLAVATVAFTGSAAAQSTYQTQISIDDFSADSGPLGAPAGTISIRRQVGPRPTTGADTVSRDQVVRERDRARALGEFQPGTDYLRVIGAPNDPALMRQVRPIR